jgi:hypothetical protein
VTNQNESGDRSEVEKQRSISEPNAVGETLIADYVILDLC